MDINLTEDLDFVVENDIIDYVDDDNNEMTLLTALYTDGVVDDERGYWLPEILTSDLWVYDQSRIDENIENDIEDSFQDVLNEFVELELYSSYETEISSESNYVDVKIIAYKDNTAPVLEKTIRITGNA